MEALDSIADFPLVDRRDLVIVSSFEQELVLQT